MRTLPAWAVCMLSTGCVIVPCGPGFLTAWRDGVKVIEIPVGSGPRLRIPSAVVRTAAEFETILDRAISELGATAAEEFVQPLKEGEPDFDKQVLILVRHDASSDSSFRFSSYVDPSRKLICKIRTRRSGTNRDMYPYWFAVAVDKRAATGVEVWVDDELQEKLGPLEP